MKDKFFEYYPLTQEELSVLWQNSLLVIDTNVLLDLYRFSESSRKDLLGILGKFNDKLWMPYQVGWEYHNNRENVIEIVFGLVDILDRQISNSFEGLITKFRAEYSRNPFLSVEMFENKLNKTKDSLVKFVRSKYVGAPGIMKEDSILSELNRLYDGKIGEDFSSEELKNLYGEGKGRYAASIPPGYKDLAKKKDKGDRHLYGDLIIWKDMIRKARSDKKDVFFVTNDLKEDWMRIVDGEKRGPRWELIREFYNESNGQKVVIMSLERFVGFVHSLPDYTVKPKTIKEVETVLEDELRRTLSEKLKLDALFEAILNAQRSASGPSKLLEQIQAISKTPAAFGINGGVHVADETPGAGKMECEEEGGQDKDQDQSQDQKG